MGRRPLEDEAYIRAQKAKKAAEEEERRKNPPKPKPKTDQAKKPKKRAGKSVWMTFNNVGRGRKSR
ncbi:hypothetical protein [Saccharopolyspora hattusasensis]|uniref:hypothetical protein n=1 Tax=Saccharopolyspora hattusasensis TaxID=1128679 RepID=UPI003D96F593